MDEVKMKTGLVLEGGAMRGLFSAGVMDVLMEHQIAFDGAIGVSAGAAFGCNYKSRQPGRVIRYNTEYARDPRYCSLRSLFKTGDLFGADFCYHELPNKLDPFDTEAFQQNPMEFYVVCTDVLTGEAVYQKCGIADDECFEWLRASASMPLVSRTVEIGGRRMLDGGIADSIPLRYFEQIGYNKILVILTQPEGYRKKKNKALPLIRLSFRQYPKMVEALEKHHKKYNDTLAYVKKREREGAVLVLRPQDSLSIGRVEHNPERMRQVYDCGRKVALQSLEQIEAFLR